MAKPVVYDYLDYRAFLRDLFNHCKNNNSHFSYRYFARKAGFAGPNFLKLVTDGQRNLTHTSVRKIAKGFKLKKQESEFFEYLVFMNQARSHEEKNHYYRRMLAVKEYLQNHRIDKAKYDYFSKWYYPAIREVITFRKSGSTPDRIAQQLNPRISVKEAEKALAMLLELGLIRQDTEGNWTQVDKVITTGAEVRSQVVANYHKEMLSLAVESIDRHPSEERDITALTISVKKEKLIDIKDRIAGLRRELLEMAVEDEDSDCVYQINMQVFPLASTKAKGGKNDA